MKSLILSAILLTLSLSFAHAESGAKGNQTSNETIKIIRDWK